MKIDKCGIIQTGLLQDTKIYESDVKSRSKQDAKTFNAEAEKTSEIQH
jgi:hypothetical protein